jgi:hypothetical protein
MVEEKSLEQISLNTNHEKNWKKLGDAGVYKILENLKCMVRKTIK